MKSPITKNEFFDIRYDNNDWEDMDDPLIVDQRRWVTVYEQVFLNQSSNKYYEFSWEEPNSETQEGSESDEVYVHEVEPFESIVTLYKPVK